MSLDSDDSGVVEQHTALTWGGQSSSQVHGQSSGDFGVDVGVEPGFFPPEGDFDDDGDGDGEEGGGGQGNGCLTQQAKLHPDRQA